MDVKTTYLGMLLRSPLVASASPLSESIGNIKWLEDAGAGAVVLYSLFEEQIRHERKLLHHHMLYGTESHAEALTYFPEPERYSVGPDGYLEHIRKAREAVNIPIIASLNGMAIGGWTQFARSIEQAGADALELNIYFIPTEVDMTGAQVERRYVDIVTAVRETVSLPIAVKISPFFSNVAYMADQLDVAGANALVLFNRFYQPDIDLDVLEVRPNVLLSTSQSLRLPLRWIAILYGRVGTDFAASGGVHTGRDSAKLILSGANVTMMTSALLRHGIDYIRTVEHELIEWMEQHEYNAVEEMRGALSQIHCEDPSAFERAQYMRALTHYPREGLS